MLMNRSGPPAENSSHKAVRLARALRRIRGFTVDLYAALRNCCQDGICHAKHEVDLFLESRVDAVDEILRPAPAKETENASILTSQLIFMASHPMPAQTWCHKLPIQVLKKYERDTPVDSTSTPAKSRVRIVLPDVPKETTPTPTNSSLTPVYDFCATIAAAKCGSQSIAFVLSGSARIGKVITNENTILSQNKVNKVTLKAILSDSASLAYSIGFSLRLRMLLALRLASNLLQLSQTRWLSHSWCKETVYFLLLSTNKGGRPSVDLSRAFTSAVIDGPEADVVACGTNTEPKEVLLEPGILLLEIWHQKTLEARFCLDESPAGYYQRVVRAMEWLDDCDDPMPDLYERAASYCIRGGSEARLVNWDANELWSGVCKNVIEPLSQNCKQWRRPRGEAVGG